MVGETGEEVGEAIEVVGEAGEVVGASPPAHSYSTVKSGRAADDPSSAALSHAQPRPSSNTSHHPHMPRHRVEYAIGLSPFSIADEDSR